MPVNNKMLPMKAHYFFSNAGIAALLPYMSTYARQLGFSSYAVGLIYTVLPIIGSIAKPLFGAISDRFRKQKTVFIFFEILTAVSFLGIYYIPGSPSEVNVELACGDGETFLNSCFANEAVADQCAAQRVIAENYTSKCEMTCPMTSPSMWQTVCEHWRVPQYCYSSFKSLNFRSIIKKNEAYVENDCVNFNLGHVIMDDNLPYIPKCREEHGMPYFGSSCVIYCPNKEIDTLVNSKAVTLSCRQNNTRLQSCSHELSVLKKFLADAANVTDDIECKTVCQMTEPWQWMMICDGWGADDTLECQPRTEAGQTLPKEFSFTAYVPLSKTDQEKECVYFKVNSVLLKDGSAHYPTCPQHHTHSKINPLFRSNCSIRCDNILVNELISSTKTNTKGTSNELSSKTFWLFFLLMTLSWVGMAVVVSVGDTICFDMLGDNPSKYGQQRLWGSVGWGLVSILTGLLIDLMSEGSETKNHVIGFAFMLVFTSFDVCVSTRLNYKAMNYSVNILKDVALLLMSWHMIIYLLWTISVGFLTGLLWQFQFWYLEDLAKEWECSTINYIKTLQGLVSGIQCFGGELPIMFLSGKILKRIGHVHGMSLVLGAYGFRFILYSILNDPWWILPIELLQGITLGLFYPTMASYASIVAPSGTEATVQGLVGGAFEGIGVSIGSLMAGILYGLYGGRNTFRWYGCVALVLCLLHAIVQWKLPKKSSKSSLSNGRGQEEYPSIIKYATPNDAIHMLDSQDDSSLPN